MKSFQDRATKCVGRAIRVAMALVVSVPSKHSSAYLRKVADRLNKLLPESGAGDAFMFSDDVAATCKRINKLVRTVNRGFRDEAAVLGNDPKSIKMGKTQLNSALSPRNFRQSVIRDLEDRDYWDIVVMNLHDMADHIDLAHGLLRCQSRRKLDKLSSLDTASREQIPARVWNYIER